MLDACCYRAPSWLLCRQCAVLMFLLRYELTALKACCCTLCRWSWKEQTTWFFWQCLKVARHRYTCWVLYIVAYDSSRRASNGQISSHVSAHVAVVALHKHVMIFLISVHLTSDSVDTILFFSRLSAAFIYSDLLECNTLFNKVV